MSQPPTELAHERALIAAARAGDKTAFEQLVSEHSPRVYGALRRFGLDAQEADEVAQQVFVRAWRGLPVSRNVPGFPRGSTGSHSMRPNENSRAARHRPSQARRR